MKRKLLLTLLACIGLLVYAGESDPFEASVRTAVERQLQQYPKSTLKDLYKNFFQDVYGPGHLVNDTASAGAYLRKELAGMRHSTGAICEPTGREGNFYRVNLSVIKENQIGYETFFDAFVRSVNGIKPMPVREWAVQWEQIQKVIDKMNLQLDDYEADKLFIRSNLDKGEFVGHHSKAFEANYTPHYRIISKEVFEKEFLPLLRNSNKPYIVAYVTSWSASVPDTRYVTHINYAFGHVNERFDGLKIDNESRLTEIAQLKRYSPTLKVLLSVGGWGSGRFSEMAANETTRNLFAADCKRVVDQFNLDGIDIDWEYPTSSAAGISSSPGDKENFTLLMTSIRRAIGADRLLTLASVATANYIDFKAIEPVVDFVNIMTYDMGRPPVHHAPLYRSHLVRGLSVHECVEAHVQAGMPLTKLTMGIPFYGHGKEYLPDFIDYKDIMKLEGYGWRWDDKALVPYITNDRGRIVCTYEDPRSIAVKCSYILEKGMLGGMYWEYDGDDTTGTLRKAVFEGVRK